MPVKHSVLAVWTALLLMACQQTAQLTQPAPAAPVADAPAPQDAEAPVLGAQALVWPQTLNLTPTRPASLRPALIGGAEPYRSVTDLQPITNGISYRPRQAGQPLQLDLDRAAAERGTLGAVPARYQNWDVLIPNSAQANHNPRPDAVQFTLTRPARVALVLRSREATPAWLAGWTRAPQGVEVVRYGRRVTWPVFEKSLPAGLQSLPSLRAADGDWTYDLLIAEQGGAATPTPEVPAGQAPVAPGSVCPAWVHDQYAATGPDGQSYPTWHPPMDPVYWCSFGHEHGSAPQVGDPLPLYGYASDLGGMPNERTKAHAGFKGYSLNMGAGRWYITQHMGTGGLGRACTAMHTLDMSYVENGVLKINYHLMGDFGRGMAVANAVGTRISSCVATAGTERSQGVRDLNLRDGAGYEAWRVDLGMAGALGFSSGRNVPTTFTLRTHDPITGCPDVACTSLMPFPGQFGTMHTLIFDNLLRLRPKTSGVFYTDSMGMMQVAAGTPGAVRQYAAPGTDLSLSSPLCWTASAWGGPLTCGGALRMPTKNVENSMTGVN